MNTEDAKLILASVHQEAEPDSETEQAFALLDREPKLHAWFQEEKAFDVAISSKLAEIEPPADLRAELIGLLANEAEPGVPAQIATAVPKKTTWFLPPLLAAAATLILIPVFAIQMFTSRANANSFDDFRQDMAEFAAGKFKLDHTDSELPKLYDWLNANNATCPTDLSVSVGVQDAVGCKVIEWNDESVTLICVRNETDQVVHCFVLPRDEFEDLPDEKLMRSRFMVDDLETRGWTDQDYLYLMVGSQKGVQVPTPKP